MAALSWLAATMVALQTPATPEPPSLSANALRTLRALPVQHEGRWSPLDTVARDVVQQVTGTPHWQGRDPMLNLLDWTFRPDVCRAEPLIRVRSGEVRRLLKLPLDRDRFSLSFLQEHAGLNERLAGAMRKRGQNAKIDALDAKAEDIGVAMSMLIDLLQDEVIRPVPDPNDPKGRWTSISRAAGHDVKALEPVRQQWQAVRSAFLAADASGLERAADALTTALGRLQAAHRPDSRLIALELRYNRLNPFRWSWVIAAVASGVALLAMIARRRWIDVVVWAASAAAFGVCTWGLAMRWQLADRIPAANMYESIIFMGWGLCLSVLVCLVVVRQRLVTFVASLLAAVSLMLGDLLPIDSFLRPVAPVLLDTAWMAIHVPVVMVSYSVLAIAMGFGLALLVIAAAAPSRDDLIAATDRLHCRFIQVGVILLTAGIVTGSMWGSASWGRYWGWDPKEVWSLIAMLGYVAVLHARAVRWLHAVGTALCSTLAFWLVVMAYVGVNYVLGIGLHSYGFGKGAVVRWLLIVGSAQLVLTMGSVVLYEIRRRSLPTPVPVQVGEKKVSG